MEGRSPGMRLYRALCGCLPHDLRRDFGGDMEQLLADRLREAGGRPWAAARLWVAAFADLAWAVVMEWAARGFRAARTSGWRGTSVDVLIQDLRFGARSLLRRPGFAAAAIATLALGIGATVSIFSVVNSVLLRPLPYPDSDRLVVVYATDAVRSTRSTSVDHPDIRAWQEAIPEISLAGYSHSTVTLTGLGDPDALQAARVTDGLLDLMGYAPHLGRDLRASDDVPDGPQLVVVSHGFWSERLGRDPAAVGRIISLNGDSWEVVGVAPEEFDFPRGAQLWMPRRHQAEGCGHGCRLIAALGKLDAGASLASVQERFDVVDRRLQEAYPDSHRDTRTELAFLMDHEVGSIRAGLWILFGAVGMVLLVACANVASLLLIRAHQRRGEVALRSTLGASRGRVFGQLVIESALLALPAGLIGAALAVWGTNAFVALAPEGLPRLEEASVDGAALAFTLLLVAAVTTIFGAMPAAHLSRDLTGSLGSGSRTAGEGTASRSRSFLLVGEVAISLALLLGAGLLFRTMIEIRSVDLGFESAGVERFRVSVPESRYDSLAVGRFFGELEDRLAALPGVRAVGSGFGVPFASGRIGTSVNLLDRPELPPPDRPSVDVRPSSPGYLSATGTPLLRGRWFTEDDRSGSEGVAVINRTAARLHYGDTDPIGKQLHLSVSFAFEEDPIRTIVGVVEDVRVEDATAEPEPAVYLPNAQFGMGSMYVTLRHDPGRSTLMPEVREVVRSMDASLAMTNVERVEDAIAREHASSRFYMMLLGVFSALALALTAVGLYGVVAFAVSRRTSEIGVRIALGARGGDVLSLMLRQGLRPAGVGIVLGLLICFAGARLLESLLYGVSPTDPLTVAATTLTLVAVVLVATVVPARRASRIPPAHALRAD